MATIADLSPEAVSILNVLKNAMNKAERLHQLTQQYDGMLLAASNADETNMVVNLALPMGNTGFRMTRKKDELLALVLTDTLDQISDLRKEIAAITKTLWRE